MTTLPQIDRFIPLTQAAKRLGITTASSKQRIASGNVKAASLNGTLAVAERDLDQIIPITREQFAQLRSQEIAIGESVERYHLKSQTVRNWIEHGYIQVLKEGYAMQLDRADVAYCAAVYQSLGGMRGKRLFDDDGQPYQNPTLSS
ncbi:MAG TPA: hypothetical protein VFF59_09665 [Anaerolineae bacterium]|nr:hypothetical protein [Anaerolineae bacterium]